MVTEKICLFALNLFFRVNLLVFSFFFIYLLIRYFLFEPVSVPKFVESYLKSDGHIRQDRSNGLLFFREQRLTAVWEVSCDSLKTFQITDIGFIDSIFVQDICFFKGGLAAHEICKSIVAEKSRKVIACENPEHRAHIYLIGKKCYLIERLF